MLKKIKKYSIIIFVFFAAITVVGFVSNFLSISSTNKKTKAYLIATLENEPPSKGKTINWLKENDIKRYDEYRGDISDVEIFGFKTPPPWFYPSKVYMPKEQTESPWAYIKPREWDLPFIVFDYYGWVAAPLWGRGGVKIYFCLFGFTIEIYDHTTWFT